MQRRRAKQLRAVRLHTGENRPVFDSSSRDYHVWMRPTDISHLLRQLKSRDANERRSAARDLGRLYAESQPPNPSLISVAEAIGDVNDQTADVAAPFIRQFTNPKRPPRPIMERSDQRSSH